MKLTQSALQIIFSIWILLFSCVSLAAQGKKTNDLSPDTIRTAEDLKPEWKSCTKNKDCISGLVGCWSWLPINKKYVTADKGLFHGHLIQGAFMSCRASKDPGPPPKVFCRKGLCGF